MGRNKTTPYIVESKRTRQYIEGYRIGASELVVPSTATITHSDLAGVSAANARKLEGYTVQDGNVVPRWIHAYSQEETVKVVIVSPSMEIQRTRAASGQGCRFDSEPHCLFAILGLLPLLARVGVECLTDLLGNSSSQAVPIGCCDSFQDNHHLYLYDSELNILRHFRIRDASITKTKSRQYVDFMFWQGHVESNHDPRFWRPIY